MESSQPRKQRKYRYTAPMHTLQKFAHAHVSKKLSEKLGIKIRSIEVRRGDTVRVMRGGQKGKTGKVTGVDLKRGFVFVDGIVRKNARGKEINIPIRVSNVYITDLDLSDKLRAKKIESFKKL